jgi:hypothetical protein
MNPYKVYLDGKEMCTEGKVILHSSQSGIYNGQGPLYIHQVQCWRLQKGTLEGHEWSAVQRVVNKSAHPQDGSHPSERSSHLRLD